MATTMERPGPRPRSKSGFSFKSSKSDRSAKIKIDLHETHEEKRRSHLTETSKANPNAAMVEAEPIDLARQQATLESLRAFQYKDAQGNPITEPDLSNPTRPRWERPLDTIRSFEAAIDGGYKRRSAMARQESVDNNGFQSRRSSYIGGYDHNQSTTRLSQIGSYYQGNGRQRPDSYYDNGYGAPGPSQQRRPYSHSGRTHSEPLYSRNHNNGPQQVYPSHGYQQSYDTVNTGSNGSNTTGEWNNHTDPSSENSSIDRVNAPAQPKPDLGEQYGFSGFGGGPNFQEPIMEEYGPGPNGKAPRNDSYFSYDSNSNNVYSSPPPPPHKTLNKTMSNGQHSGMGGPVTYPPVPQQNGNGAPNRLSRPPPQEKRKSWFKKKFSKD